MYVTVFTPTYNREKTLVRLYNSLCAQTNKEFEWLVVDDGSNDGTSDLIATWIKDNRINIRYYRKDNGGKPSAYNVAVQKANGELFVCVDSDDYLEQNALERVKIHWDNDREYRHDGNKVIGLVYLRKHIDGKTITEYCNNAEYATLDDLYRKYGMKGDTMLVYRTEITKKYLFPVFPNEKFIPEAYIYDQYDQEGVLHLIKEALYVCEYLPDGYTAKMREINHDNPKGYEMYITQRIGKDERITDLIEDTIRYISIKLVMKDGRILKDAHIKSLTFAMLPFGLLLYLIMYKRYD